MFLPQKCIIFLSRVYLSPISVSSTCSHFLAIVLFILKKYYSGLCRHYCVDFMVFRFRIQTDGALMTLRTRAHRQKYLSYLHAVTTFDLFRFYTKCCACVHAKIRSQAYMHTYYELWTQNTVPPTRSSGYVPVVALQYLCQKRTWNSDHVPVVDDTDGVTEDLNYDIPQYWSIVGCLSFEFEQLLYNLQSTQQNTVKSTRYCIV